MNSLSTFYFQPSILQLEPNFKFQTREKLGLDPRINIYGCIQMSFKINRNYELMLKHILDKDPNGYIMMSTYKPFCKSQIDRIIKTFGNNNSSKFNLRQSQSPFVDRWQFFLSLLFEYV